MGNTSLAKVVSIHKKNEKILKAAEKRLAKRKLRPVSNADHIRHLTVVALRYSHAPLSLYQLQASFQEVCKFKIKSEYLLMSLLQKRDETGIALCNSSEIKFTLAYWATAKERKAV